MADKKITFVRVLRECGHNQRIKEAGPDLLTALQSARAALVLNGYENESPMIVEIDAALNKATGGAKNPNRESWELLGEHEGKPVYVDSVLYYKDTGKPADVVGCFNQMTKEIRDNLTWDAPSADGRIKNETIEVGDSRWLVREAKNRQEAMNAIASARCSGAVGFRLLHDAMLCGGSVEVLADVVQINSDGTERKPYTEAC